MLLFNKIKLINITMKLIYYLILITILFIIYVEYSVGSILLRYNSLGNRSINILSMLNFLVHPLYNSYLWNIKTLDINYPFIIVIANVLYYYIKCV